jgi:hypothetical protein
MGPAMLNFEYAQAFNLQLQTGTTIEFIKSGMPMNRRSASNSKFFYIRRIDMSKENKEKSP